MQSIVYHQTAGRSSPKGADEIQGRFAALDDIRMYVSPQASYTFNDMPSRRLVACGLDKKIRILANADFLRKNDPKVRKAR